jgi:hypothetical protein
MVNMYRVNLSNRRKHRGAGFQFLLKPLTFLYIKYRWAKINLKVLIVKIKLMGGYTK